MFRFFPNGVAAEFQSRTQLNSFVLMCALNIETCFFLTGLPGKDQARQMCVDMFIEHYSLCVCFLIACVHNCTYRKAQSVHDEQSQSNNEFRMERIEIVCHEKVATNTVHRNAMDFVNRSRSKVRLILKRHAAFSDTQNQVMQLNPLIYASVCLSLWLSICQIIIQLTGWNHPEKGLMVLHVDAARTNKSQRRWYTSDWFSCKQQTN